MNRRGSTPDETINEEIVMHKRVGLNCGGTVTGCSETPIISTERARKISGSRPLLPRDHVTYAPF